MKYQPTRLRIALITVKPFSLLINCFFHGSLDTPTNENHGNTFQAKIKEESTNFNFWTHHLISDTLPNVDEAL